MADYLILESDKNETMNFGEQMVAIYLGSLAWKLKNVEKLPENLIIYQNPGELNEDVINMINEDCGIELSVDDFRFFPAGVKKLADAICKNRNIPPLNIACCDSGKYDYPYGNWESSEREFDTRTECEKNNIFYVNFLSHNYEELGEYIISLEGGSAKLKNRMQEFANSRKPSVQGGNGGNKEPVRQDKNDGDER